MDPEPFRRAIALLRLPQERDRRDELAALAVPRVLLVEPGAPVPDIEEDEDWLRLPASDRDVAARVENLALRLAAAVRLEGRVLHSARGAVTLSDGQTAAAALLAGGGCVARSAFGLDGRALDDLLYKLRRRLRPIGLDLVVTRGRGVTLGARAD